VASADGARLAVQPTGHLTRHGLHRYSIFEDQKGGNNMYFGTLCSLWGDTCLDGPGSPSNLCHDCTERWGMALFPLECKPTGGGNVGRRIIVPGMDGVTAGPVSSPRGCLGHEAMILIWIRDKDTPLEPWRAGLV
jgi:hypothetical protein